MIQTNKFTFLGDSEIGRQFVGEASSQMNILLNQLSFQNLSQGIRDVQPYPGVFIRCRKVYSFQECTIIVAAEQSTSPDPPSTDWLGCWMTYFNIGWLPGSRVWSELLGVSNSDPTTRAVLFHVPVNPLGFFSSWSHTGNEYACSKAANYPAGGNYFYISFTNTSIHWFRIIATFTTSSGSDHDIFINAGASNFGACILSLQSLQFALPSDVTAFYSIYIQFGELGGLFELNTLGVQSSLKSGYDLVSGDTKSYCK